MSTPTAQQQAADDAAKAAETQGIGGGDQVSAYRWALAYALLIILLMLFSKLRVGYTILYYLAVLTLLFILLTQYQSIAWVLNPFVAQQQQGAG